MNNKTILGGLAGGVAFFLLSMLIYGFLLMDYQMENTCVECMKGENEMIMWSLTLSSFLWGFFTAIIFDWSNTKSFMSGLQRGALLGCLSAAAIDFGLYGSTHFFSNMNSVIVDIVCVTAMVAIAGGIIAWVLGREKKESA